MIKIKRKKKKEKKKISQKSTQESTQSRIRSHLSPFLISVAVPRCGGCTWVAMLFRLWWLKSFLRINVIRKAALTIQLRGKKKGKRTSSKKKLLTTYWLTWSQGTLKTSQLNVMVERNLTANFSRDQRPVQRSVLRFAVRIYIQLKMSFCVEVRSLKKLYITWPGSGLG